MDLSEPTDRRRQAYIRRRGRLTSAQARGLDLFAACYRAAPADIAEAAARGAVGIEIGFGMGQALLDWSVARPDLALFGIELYLPGIGSVCDQLAKGGITNVRVIDQPAEQVFEQLPGGCVDEIRIFFPDPWPKKRHHKRRLIQPHFVTELERVLRPDGILRIATDWAPYADWIEQCLSASSFHDAAESDDAGTARPTTKFEARGERLGHDIRDYVLTRR